MVSGASSLACIGINPPQEQLKVIIIRVIQPSQQQEFRHLFGTNPVIPTAKWEAAKQQARLRFAQREKDVKAKKSE